MGAIEKRVKESIKINESLKLVIEDILNIKEYNKKLVVTPMLPRQEINNLEYQVNFIDFYYNNSKNINKPPLEFIRNFSPNSDSDKIYDIKIIPICVVMLKVIKVRIS